MELYRVRLMNEGENVQYSKDLKTLCESFECDVLIHVEKKDTLYVFPHLITGPMPFKLQPRKNDQPVGQFFFKRARGLSKVSIAGLDILADIMEEQHEKDAHKIPTVYYDLKRKEFVDAKKLLFGKSKRIQHIDPVVGLGMAHSKHMTKHSAFSEEYNAFPAHGIKFDLPSHSEEPSSSTTNYSVQATDGPHENVVFQRSVRHDGMHDNEATGRQRALCRHPEYFEPQRRRQSFGRWPHQDDVQDIDRLVQCGFYFTETFDMVRCYQCGLGLKDWSYSDDPWLEHVRYSPHCLHLQNALESSLLEQYRITTATGFHGRHNSAEASAFTFRHPKYVSLESRLETFSKWPSDRVQTPAQLAEAGFFYTGLSDQVRCYACDGGLQHWTTDDEPWIEHARWFSHCQHVRASKGEVFIEMVQMAVREAEDEERDQDPEMDNLAETLNAVAVNGASTGQLESDDPVYLPEAQKVINILGFSKAAVKMVIQECAEKKIRWNADILASMLYEKQSQGETLPQDSLGPISSTVPNIDDSTHSGEEAEHTKLLSRLKCMMCEENDSNVLFLPCAHHKMCTGCSSDVQICPICCKEIKQKIRTYMV